MKRGNQIIAVTITSFVLSFLSYTASYSAREEGPAIHIEQTEHTFPTTFEGEALAHTFVLYNRGTADLHIRRVAHS
jgi:hypothetical protein